MDYTALLSSMIMLDVQEKTQVFADVRVMEQALIKELSRG